MQFGEAATGDSGTSKDEKTMHLNVPLQVRLLLGTVPRYLPYGTGTMRYRYLGTGTVPYRNGMSKVVIADYR